MPYLGRGLEKGNYLKLDDISSQFDGSKTTFNLTVGGSAHVPGSSYSLLVSLSGIIQEGEAAYTLDQNQITFAAAPQAVDDCYIISLGTPIGIGVPGDGTVSGPQFAKPFNYENFFYLDHTTQRVGIGTTVPTQSLDVYDGNIAIRDPATASQFLGFYHNRNVLKASIDKTGNNLTFENVDSGIIDFKNNGSSRVGIGSTGKIFFASDDNTYFYRPGADTLGFLAGGNERLRINGDRVIIGLSNSSNLPTFNASTTLATVYTDNPGAFNAIAIVGGHTTGAAFVKFGDRDNERQGQIGYYNEDDSMRFFVNGNTTEKLRISGIGSVGINTNSPQKQLVVRTASGDDGGILVKPNVNYGNNQNRAYLTVATDQWTGATTNWNTYGFQHRMKSNGSGVGRITIDTNSGEAFCVENGGNVGIGTNDPVQNLHVFGNVQIDGDSASTASLDIDNQVNLGNTAGSEQLLLKVRGNIANDGQLIFKNIRLSNGSNWETSAFRVQRRVDVSNFGYIDFGTGAGGAGRNIQFGTGNGAIMMHLDNTAKVGINTTVPQSRLHVFQGKSGFDYGTTGNLIVENDGGSTVQILAPNTHTSSVHFGDNDNGMVGRIVYDHTTVSYTHLTLPTKA